MEKQKFNIFVISMPEAIQRQKSAIEQLDKLSLNYELKLFERTTTIDIQEYDRKKRLRLYGYDMNPGEIGVFLSHRSLWKNIKESDCSALILEDDFLITHPDIKNILSAVEKLSKKCGIIRLQTCTDNKTYSLSKVLDTNLVTYSHKKQGGATAYFINTQAAKRLYKLTHKFAIPVDDFIDLESLHKIIVYGIKPPPINITNQESEIGENKKPAMSLWTKLKREIYRLPIVFKQMIFEITVKRKVIKQSDNLQQKITLNAKHFIDKGGYESVYRHPNNDGLCIKIKNKASNSLRQRQIREHTKVQRKIQQHPDNLYAKYHGTIATSLGKGMVYDLIRDNNGKISRTLQYYINNKDKPLLATEKEILLQELHYKMAKYKVFCCDMNLSNVLCRIIDNNKKELIIVDGLCDRTDLYCSYGYMLSVLRFLSENGIYNKKFLQYYFNNNAEKFEDEIKLLIGNSRNKISLTKINSFHSTLNSKELNSFFRKGIRDNIELIQYNSNTKVSPLILSYYYRYKIEYFFKWIFEITVKRKIIKQYTKDTK